MVRLTQNSFLGGQLDYEMMGRQDFARYAKGASRLVNFNIMRRGGICKRQGFDRVLDLSALGLGAYVDNGVRKVPKVRLIPFAHTKDKGYVILVSSGRMWAVRSDKSADPYNQQHEIGTPAQVFNVVNSDGGTSIPYVGDEIDELDYQQCGDVLFIAHQNHPPAKITHGIEAGTNNDYFTYEQIAVRTSASGTPAISGCTLSRSAVQCYGAAVTEKYVATAVFSSGETVPCSEYYSTTTDNTPSSESHKTNTWAGTTYYLPWTESQKITIKVTPRARTMPDGTIEYPSEIRLYKKAFNYYGLIATAKVAWGGYAVKALTSDVVGKNGATTYYDDELEEEMPYSWVEEGNPLSSGWDPADGNPMFFVSDWNHATGGDDGRSDIRLLENGLTYSMRLSDGSAVQAGSQVKIGLGGEYASFDNYLYAAVTETGETLSRYDEDEGGYVTWYVDEEDAKAALLEWNQEKGIQPITDTEPSSGFVVNVATAYFTHVANKCRRFVVRAHSTATVTARVAAWSNSDADVDTANADGVVSWIARATAGNDAESGTYMSEITPVFNPDTGKVTSVQVEDFDSFRSRMMTGAFETWRRSLDDYGREIVLTLGTGSWRYLRIYAGDVENGQLVEGNDLVMGFVVARTPSSAPKAITIDDRNTVPDSSVTPLEPIDNSLFSGAGNYPASVSLTQQRLVWASSKNDPARIWMSQVGDFYTYNPHQIQVPDDPIDFVVPVTRFAKINHIVEMRKLLMFNSACEWMVDSASSVSGLTYETIQAYPQSYSGSSARLKPLVCNNSVVFCERSGQSVRRFAWDLTNDGFAGKDVSILSSSIFESNPIVDWTYQQFPYSTVWCALADGTAASFEYMEEQDILAWATHRYGDAKSRNGKFRCFATTYSLSPALDMMYDATAREHATHEAVFAVVENGYYDDGGTWIPTGQWIERMRVRSAPKDSVYHSLCMDGLRVLNKTNRALPMDVQYTAPDTYAWMNLKQNEGLVYLEKAKKDGSEVGGALTPITREAALARLLDPDDADVEIYEGYCFMSEYMSVFPVISRSVTGAGQMDIKDIGNVALRLMASSGGTVRAEGCPETEPIRYDDDPGAIKTPKFLGNGVVQFFDVDAANVKPVGINTRDGRFHVEQDLPWPFTMLMFELDVETEVSRG